MSSAKFELYDIVEKATGACFWGIIVSRYDVGTLQGLEPSWRYDVMSTEPRYYGTIHIMSENQIVPMTNHYVMDPGYRSAQRIQERMRNG